MDTTSMLAEDWVNSSNGMVAVGAYPTHMKPRGPPRAEALAISGGASSSGAVGSGAVRGGAGGVGAL